ncbi:hypothetical protein C0995_008392 [Termitomyces sp. Mi166|nr:hypothetical protein C0995_008392 [Termitomyces sp. Mi166\
MKPGKWSITAGKRIERPLGDSESAFFPASKDGLGDIFLPPESVQAALEEAKGALYFRHEWKKGALTSTSPVYTPQPTQSYPELISGYMNGPRTLSNAHLSYLVISSPNLGSCNIDDVSGEHDYDLLMCAPHFTGDGTSLHQCTHDLLALLASSVSDEDILASIDLSQPWINRLPPAFETRCTVPRSQFARGVSKINFLMTREKEIGGHKLTRFQRAPQRTVFLERVFDETQTKAILRRCKENGVTINHAIEALSGVAWARVINASNKHSKDAFRDPVRTISMVYTAINVRPHLVPSPSPDPTYWFLALTYFNLVFPTYPPSSQRVFWLRAKSAKTQTHAAVNSPLLVHRTLEMASERAARAQNKPQPIIDVPTLLNTTTGNLLPGPAPSAALLGLSLIGNLDATYDRRAYPGFFLKDVTTASRQKAGGILLLVHTFGGRLWLQLFYDIEGFGSDGEVERFWHELGNGVEEFLIS